MKLLVLRDGERQSITLTVDEWPTEKAALVQLNRKGRSYYVALRLGSNE